MSLYQLVTVVSAYKKEMGKTKQQRHPKKASMPYFPVSLLIDQAPVMNKKIQKP